MNKSKKELDQLTLDEMIALTNQVKDWKTISNPPNEDHCVNYNGVVYVKEIHPYNFLISLCRLPPINKQINETYMIHVSYRGLDKSVDLGRQVSGDHGESQRKLRKCYESIKKQSGQEYHLRSEGIANVRKFLGK
jgi:hypothetical protein